MPDFLSDVSRRLVPVASKVADALFKALTTRPGVDARVIAMFSPSAGFAAQSGADPDAYAAFLAAELERAAALAVRGYVDWVACQLIKSKGYAARPFPMPDAITVAAIAAGSDVMPSVVAFAVARLREMDDIPLLGRVDQGCLLPDQPALDRYKDCFDWNSAP